MRSLDSLIPMSVCAALLLGLSACSKSGPPSLLPRGFERYRMGMNEKAIESIAQQDARFQGHFAPFDGHHLDATKLAEQPEEVSFRFEDGGLTQVYFGFFAWKTSMAGRTPSEMQAVHQAFFSGLENEGRRKFGEGKSGELVGGRVWRSCPKNVLFRIAYDGFGDGSGSVTVTSGSAEESCASSTEPWGNL